MLDPLDREMIQVPIERLVVPHHIATIFAVQKITGGIQNGRPDMRNLIKHLLAIMIQPLMFRPRDSQLFEIAVMCGGDGCDPRNIFDNIDLLPKSMIARTLNLSIVEKPVEIAGVGTG